MTEKNSGKNRTREFEPENGGNHFHMLEQKQGTPFDFRQYLSILMRRKGLILLVTALFCFVFLYHSLSRVPVYQSTTKLLLESGGGLVVLNKKLTYVPGYSMNTFVEILKAPVVQGRIIDRLNLDMTPRQLLGHIGFVPDVNTNILQITVTHPDDRLAKEIAQTVAEVAVEEVNNIYNSSTTNAYNTIREQLEVTKVQLMKAEESIKDFLSAKGYRNLKGETNAKLDRLSKLTNKYNDAQIELNATGRVLEYQKSMLDGTPALVVKEQTISAPVQMEIVKLETELAKARINYSEKHPKINNLLSSIDALKELLNNGVQEELSVQTVGDNPIRQALVNEINSRNSERVRAGAQQDELVRLINEVEGRLENAPSDELSLSRLEREKQGLEGTYFSLLAKHEEARMMKDTAAGNLSILEEADLIGPIHDNIFVNLLIAILLGQLVGGALAVIIDTLDPRIKFSSKIEDTLGVPVLGLIPELREEELFVRFDTPKSRIAEAYHIIKSNINNTMPKDKPWSLQVSSAFQGEGKTVVSINLAMAMALAGKPTVLIDGDMRRTYLHEKFKVQKHGGLSEYILGEASLDDVLKDTEFPSLKVITSGRKPQNPPHLLHSHEASNLMKELISRGYYVIIDSPALLPIVDASVIASFVDGVIVVFREESTRKYTAQKTIERLQRIGAKISGTVLNQASIKGYGYYYYYGYRYGYDYGYSEKVEAGS